MGRAQIDRPKKLSSKLILIRESMGLSQNGMINQLGLADSLTQAEISKIKKGKRIPSLLVLLRYARAFGIHVDDLIDDDVNLTI